MEPLTHEGDDRAGFLIATEPSIDGKTYIVTLAVSPDFIITLTPVRASAYASALLSAVAQAEYDAAIYAQITSRLGLDHNDAAMIVKEMRADRTPIEASGLRFEPGVSQRKKHPYVHFYKDDHMLGQMDVPSARRHALHVLEAPAAADLDALYLKVLRGQIGLDEHVGRQVVANLGEHREPWSVSDE